MKGDFSRLLVNDNYIMTLMQQGRVQLDSDWNVQVIQQWMYLKTMTAAILGEHGGPKDFLHNDLLQGHFKIMEKADSTPTELDFKICEGNYFVDGTMCVNHEECSYSNQPYGKSTVTQNERLAANSVGLVYLKVWLRHVTQIEDPTIREVALGGPDTTTRVQLVWQVMVAPVESGPPVDPDDPNENPMTMDQWADKIRNEYEYFTGLLPAEERAESGKLEAYVVKPEESDDPCILPPEAGYRGTENQLYRVEILYPGAASSPDAQGNADEDGPPEGKAVFVWSRDNGSVVYPIEKPDTNVVTLKTLWADDRYAIHVGDWVEIGDETSVLSRTSLPLRQVTAVDTGMMQITLEEEPSWGGENKPFIRRWDSKGKSEWGGGLPVVESSDNDDNPIELEKGIFIEFKAGDQGCRYNKNDYWLIPARTASGDIEWPPEKVREPIRDGCWYAPLALIEIDVSGNIKTNDGIHDTRRQFGKIW